MAFEALAGMWDLATRIFDPFLHALRACKRKITVRVFFLLRLDKVDDTSLDVEGLVFGLTGKRLLVHRVFRNLGNRHVFIAVAAYDPGNPLSFWVYLLEQFGPTFRIAWQSGESYGWIASGRDFGIHDLDSDGVHEISFSDGSFGTGGGMSTLCLFVPKLGVTYSLEVIFDWQNHSSGPTPKIRLRPEDEQPQTRFYHKALEKMATDSGFLDGVNLPDLKNPLFADLRWHRDHGSIRNGSIVLRAHFFEGPPVFRGSTEATLDEGHVVWIAYFKGPVVAHFVKDGRHAVIYCPDDIYCWPTCFCRLGHLLLIGTRGDGIIVYNERENLLTRFVSNGEYQFAEVYDIVLSQEDVLINDSLRVPSSFFLRFSGSFSSQF